MLRMMLALVIFGLTAAHAQGLIWFTYPQWECLQPNEKMAYIGGAYVALSLSWRMMRQRNMQCITANACATVACTFVNSPIT